jgi:methylated-DNA-[protein]-cysteine S-methyltransferase
MKTFAEKAYDLLRKVPQGRVTTYKEIAQALGTKAYRGVGQAMKRNPYAPEVP